MAKSKTIEVSKFGGTDSLGTVKDQNETDFKSEISGKTYSHKEVDYDVQSVETQSKTRLEDDQGFGSAAIIRCFEFGMNPQAFIEARPTKQDIFNAHYKGIEMALWKDGLTVIPEIHPRIVTDATTGRYKIFVTAKPQKGHILREKPQTLSEIAYG